MNLNDWLRYIEQPRNISPGVARLNRVREVALTLNLLPLPYRVITVTGTNGKGSTVAFCSHILQAAGYKVGSYSSPHLFQYNERIAVQNQPVADEAICDAFAAIEAARGQIELSYFEYSFLAALFIFKHSQLAVAVLEIGIGGRLDAVNVVDADVAIVTTVDFDHMHYLGHSREAIAYEKAGIFRSQVPAIYGDRDLPDAIAQEAAKLNAPLFVLGQDYDFAWRDNDWQWQGPQTSYQHLPVTKLYLANAATALMALQCLPMPIADTAIVQGIAAAYLSGRQQVVQGKCNILLDVAHNPQAARLLATRFAAMPKTGKVYAIFSALADKDLPGIIEPMQQLVDHWHYAPLIGPRAATLEQLHAALVDFSSIAHQALADAYQYVMQQVSAEDWLLVYGSFYTVAGVAQELQI